METENKIAQRKACWKRWPNLSMVSYKLSALIDQYLTMTFQRIENIERERARTHQREQYTQSHARACGRKTMRENRNIDFDGAHSFCFFAATINRQCLAHTHSHGHDLSAAAHIPKTESSEHRHWQPSQHLHQRGRNRSRFSLLLLFRIEYKRNNSVATTCRRAAHTHTFTFTPNRSVRSQRIHKAVLSRKQH